MTDPTDHRDPQADLTTCEALKEFASDLLEFQEICGDEADIEVTMPGRRAASLIEMSLYWINRAVELEAACRAALVSVKRSCADVGGCVVPAGEPECEECPHYLAEFALCRVLGISMEDDDEDYES